VEQSTGTIVMYGEAKILIMKLYMSVIRWRSMCSMLWWKTKLLVLSFLKNLWWIVILFWLRWRTLLCIMSLWEQFSSLIVHYFTSVMFHAFQDREFP